MQGEWRRGNRNKVAKVDGRRHAHAEIVEDCIESQDEHSVCELTRGRADVEHTTRPVGLAGERQGTARVWKVRALLAARHAYITSEGMKRSVHEYSYSRFAGDCICLF